MDSCSFQKRWLPIAARTVLPAALIVALLLSAIYMYLLPVFENQMRTLGTGIYVEDLNTRIEILVDGLQHVFLGIIGAVVLLCLYLVRQSGLMEKQRSAAEDALRKSEAQYRLLAENSSDVIWAVDLATLKYLYISPSVQHSRGYTPEEAVKLSVHETVTPDSLKRAMRVLQEELEREHTDVSPDTERSRTLDVELYCKDGSTLWSEIRVRFLRDSQGKPAALLGASRNITDRKKAEAALQRSEEKYRLLAENAKDNIWILDLDGRIQYISPSIKNILGYPEAEIMAYGFDKCLTADSRRKWRENLDRIRSMGTAGETACDLHVTMDLEQIRKDGVAVWTEVKASFMRDNNGKPTAILGITRDISERKRAEEQLFQFEKMAALGGLVAGVAHEISTPLGVGITASSFLHDSAQMYGALFERSELKRSELQKFMKIALEATDIIQSNLNRAADLIHSFKQVAVDQSTDEARRFEIKNYLEEILLSLKPKFKQTMHQIHINGPGTVELRSCPGAFSQIVTNLIMNSLIHGFKDISQGNIDFDIARDDTYLILKYRDDGAGMDSATMKRMYDPFFTTNRQHGGTGLGMHIVYNLVTQKLKGHIQCSSKPGEGVEFLLRIPLEIVL